MGSDRYNHNLANPRAPGTGCHPWILSTANLGILAGLTGNKIFEDIRSAIPPGRRKVRDREIQEAIDKAMRDLNGGSFAPRPRPESIVKDGKAALQRIISQGKISDEADVWENSPIRLLDEPEQDTVLFLETLFELGDFVFIGERYDHGALGETIRTAREWISYFKDGGKTAPFVIINPLTGTSTTTKTGKTTLRGDGNVTSFRHALIEFDHLTIEEQIRFWSAAKLPIHALIDTGGKSIHAWIDISKLAVIETSKQWEAEIKGFYDRTLIPLGVDSSCSNPARLSRLPGHFRKEKERHQKLLWLTPKGRTVC